MCYSFPVFATMWTLFVLALLLADSRSYAPVLVVIGLFVLWHRNMSIALRSHLWLRHAWAYVLVCQVILVLTVAAVLAVAAVV
ncbi:MAG: hypothetical protein JXQ75_17965 [Phycisphaerae bacterium]|nr:hypothetical protein [Phycisphaerae bacterium]